MDSTALRWFQLVADGATVTEVAELHSVSQPGVSRALAKLEEQIGTPLLTRSGRLLRPTHAGAVFKRHVDAALHDLDDGFAAIEELVDPESGSVALAFQLSLGTWLVPRLIEGFRRTHPRVRFRLANADDARAAALLAQGRVDLELTSRRSREESVDWRPLFAQPLVLAVPERHPLAHQEAVALADVADDDFVMLGRSWDLRGLTDDLCRVAGFSARVAFEADDLPVVAGFVAAGLGVAVLPSQGAGRDLPGLRTLRLTDPGAHREVGLSWSRERRLLPSAELFRRYALARGGAVSVLP